MQLHTVHSGTYSNVPVYEYNVSDVNVMRRRSDGWINATHILKVAGFDKPARTRILEREVQKGVHEKVQGGYGKYQGTWIPLPDGRVLAERNNVLEKLLPIFDFVPGDRSPPPAPKHATAASSKPRANRHPVQRKSMPAPPLSHITEEQETPYHESETPDNVTVASETYLDDYDASMYTNSRKRKRVEDVISLADQQHQLWADELLDYFMLLESPGDPFHQPPSPPPSINLDRPIDDKGHTAMHWAAAMGDLAVVKDLIGRGASIDALSKNGETPLMRAVIFTNNYDKRSMERLASWLIRTVSFTDWFGSTVFHLIATTTSSKSKYACARYYLDAILNKMAETYTPLDIEKMLNAQDRNGDTAITLAARNGARKCVRSLIGRHAAVDIPNDARETADSLIVQLNHRRRDGRHRQLSSSPFQMDNTVMSLGGGSMHPALDGHSHLSLGGGIVGSGVLNSPLGSSSQQALDAAHKSEAATALTQQIFPLLLTKSEKLAAAFDVELAERDAEVAEAERVVRGRKEEIEALKRQSMELAMRDKEDAFDEELERELAALIAECEGLVENEQRAELRTLVREAEGRGAVDTGLGNGSAGADGNGADAGAGADSKLALARRLNAAQLERQRLVREVVQNQSMAGVGHRQSEYKRLITGALGVREEDVEGMLPEIVAELEDWQGMADG